MSYAKAERTARAERREVRRKAFYAECDSKVAAHRVYKRTKERELRKKEDDRRYKAFEAELVDAVYKLEDLLASFKKNGFKDDDIKTLAEHCDVFTNRFQFGLSCPIPQKVNWGRYILHFAAYLDAFEVYEACLAHGIFCRHTSTSMDTVHFMGHKDFMEKATARGWHVSGWYEVGAFGSKREDGAFLRSVISGDRPHLPYVDTLYRLRPLSELLT